MGYFNLPTIPAVELNSDNVSFYQENRCTFSIFELLGQENETINIEYLIEPSGELECFGKNYWYQYQPERLEENGWEKIEPALIKVWLSTNINFDLILQSFFWLLLISFIPKVERVNIKNKLTISILITLLFYLHIVGEKSYYKFISREFDLDILSREFNGDLYYQNYFLYLYLITFVITIYLFLWLLETRFNNLINFIPFVFLVFGTYASLNLNFYLILFSTIGIFSIINLKFNKFLLIAYLGFSIIWIINLEQKNINFDVDKLRGFLNSSQSVSSLIFWIISYYLFVNGVFYLISESKENFNLKIFKRNLLLSSSLIYLFGNLAASNKLFNFLSYYFLGLNKFGMRNLDSISGNTWRGIAPSAEGMGEFFSFVILFAILVSYEYKIKLTISEIILLIITFFGLIRSNNFAAISSCFGLIILYLIFKTKGIKKTIIFGLLVVSSSFVVLYFQLFKDYTYSYLSSSIIYEGVQASEIEYNFVKNEDGYTPAEEANYQYLLEIPVNEANFSSSLRRIMENYTYGYNLKYIPSFNSSFNIGAKFINRSEKWGIFFAKYNPTFGEFIFGYGPQQFTHYYMEHPTKYNYGLFLPHSSLFNYLIFFGVLGSSIFIAIVTIRIFNYKNTVLPQILASFLMLNFIKSDSLLYLPNLILTILVFNYYLLDIKKEVIEKIE